MRDDEKRPRLRLLRFRTSTLLISSLLFLLPCLLFSLPGRANGGGGATGFSTTRYQHGWPFVFLERQTVQHGGSWVNKTFLPGIKPKNIDFDAEAARCMNAEHFQGVYWDCWFGLRLNVPEAFGIYDWSQGVQNESVFINRFWSSPSRWPWLGGHDGEAMRIHWLGLLVNALLLLVAFYAFACAVEYRMRKRGSHFSFSLAELLVVICVAGMFLAWITNEHQRAVKENAAVERLATVVAGVDGHMQGNRINGLPFFVSALLDHRSLLPLSETHLFRPVDHVSVDISELPPAWIEKTAVVVDAIHRVPFPIQMELQVSEETLPILEGVLDSPTIKELEIVFRFDPEWDDENDDYRDDIELGFKLKLPKAEIVTIWLQEEVDQSKQLGTIVSLQHLKRLNIHDISTEGIAFLKSVADQLPEDVFVDTYDDEPEIELSDPIKLMPIDDWFERGSFKH